MKISIGVLVLFLAICSASLAEEKYNIDISAIGELKMAHYELAEHLEDLSIVGRSIGNTKRGRAFLDLHESLDEVEAMIDAAAQILGIENIHCRNNQFNAEAFLSLKNYISSVSKRIDAAASRINTLSAGCDDKILISEYNESKSLLGKIKKILSKAIIQA